MTPERDAPPGPAHWGTAHPEDQPPRDQILGLGRLVVETRDRLGPDATPEAVASELRERGVDADTTEVARWFEKIRECEAASGGSNATDTQRPSDCSQVTHRK